MSHPNSCRKVTVWRAAWDRALSWRILTPFLNIPLLRFWIARLSFVSVSQYLSVFIAVAVAMKSTNNTTFRCQNIFAVTLPADCACLNFRGLGEEECSHWRDCCFVSGVKWYAQVFSPVTIQSKSYPFSLLSGGQIHGQSRLLAVFWSCVRIRGAHLAHTFRYCNLSVKIW